MPLFLLLIGVILTVSGIRGTTEGLGSLLKEDFTGAGNFTAWVFALILASAIGWIPGARPLSTAFLLLIIVAVLLKSGQGFFSQFQTDMKELNS